MSLSLFIATFLLPAFLISATTNFAAQISSPSVANDHHVHDHLKHASPSMLWNERENGMEKLLGHDKSKKVGNTRGRTTLQIAGSRLPDCLHACGSCSPCSLVVVSLVCASHADDAESCPISYRCMCNSKSYPVP